jgi:hypothetical protein
VVACGVTAAADFPMSMDRFRSPGLFLGLFLAIFLAIGAATFSVAGAAPGDARDDLNRLKQKIEVINQPAGAEAAGRRRTVITEPEVNAYLAIEGPAILPTGVVNPKLSILGADRVTVQAVVDLDQVRLKRNSTSLFDPLRYLRGSLEVSATGLVRAREGLGRFEFESADIEAIPIPKFLLEQIVSHYSRSAARPSGFSLDDPIALPAGIREVLVERGQAVVVQ